MRTLIIIMLSIMFLSCNKETAYNKLGVDPDKCNEQWEVVDIKDLKIATANRKAIDITVDPNLPEDELKQILKCAALDFYVGYNANGKRVNVVFVNAYRNDKPVKMPVNAGTITIRDDEEELKLEGPNILEGYLSDK